MGDEQCADVGPDPRTWRWWRLLCSIAVLNLGLWCWTAATVEARGVTALQLGLCGIYVAVCAFRSVFPRVDLERWCLIDHPLSSMALGRSCATVAEVAFAAQTAIVVNALFRSAGLSWPATLAWLIIPTLFTAQLFCWHAVITLNQRSHAIENSLWGGTYGLVAIGLALAWPRLDGLEAGLAGAGVVFGGAFAAFIAIIDVPMYLARWRASEPHGVERPASLSAGFRDAVQRRHATDDFAVWRSEVAWMTGYFSIAVWLSIGLVHVTDRIM